LTNANVLVTYNGAAVDVSRIDDKKTRTDTLVWSMVYVESELWAASWKNEMMFLLLSAVGFLCVPKRLPHTTNMEKAHAPFHLANASQPQPPPTARRPPPDVIQFTFAKSYQLPMLVFHQPLNDIVYGVKIVDADSSLVVASYNVTVIGVDGLSYGPLANVGRRLSLGIRGPTPFDTAKAAVAAEARKGVAARNGTAHNSAWATKAMAAQGPRSASPMFPQAPTMPAQWGQ
jgi:hypothetical protein